MVTGVAWVEPARAGERLEAAGSGAASSLSSYPLLQWHHHSVAHHCGSSRGWSRDGDAEFKLHRDGHANIDTDPARPARVSSPCRWKKWPTRHGPSSQRLSRVAIFTSKPGPGPRVWPGRAAADPRATSN